jgi:uncharacterized repeat protein (TIGR01451 family)
MRSRVGDGTCTPHVDERGVTLLTKYTTYFILLNVGLLDKSMGGKESKQNMPIFGVRIKPLLILLLAIVIVASQQAQAQGEVVSDLSIEKTVSPNPGTEGETLTFTLTATNHGPDLDDDVEPPVVSDTSET